MLSFLHTIWAFLESGTLWAYVAWTIIGFLGLVALILNWENFVYFMESGGFLAVVAFAIAAVAIPVILIVIPLLIMGFLFNGARKSK